MGFKLNIGKDGGGGSTGFSLKQSLNMIKAKGMSSQMIGTDVMKDGYYNTVNESGAGSPSNFNAGLRKASASGKLDDNPKFKAAVDASGEGMPMKDGPYMMGTAHGTAPTLKEDPEDDFRYESDMPGVTGTLTEFDSSDYTRGGKPAKVGQKRTDGGEVLDDYRDSKGKKRAGKSGAIKVKGVKFTDDEETMTNMNSGIYKKGCYKK